MGGIAGIVGDADEADIGALLKQMLTPIQHHGPDGSGIVIGGIPQRSKVIEGLVFDEGKGCIALGQLQLASVDGKKSLQPVQSKDGTINLMHLGVIYNLDELRAVLKDNYEPERDSDSEIIMQLIEQRYKGDLTAAVKEVAPMLDGVYSLAVTDNKQMVISCDKLGLRQLYFSTNNNHVTFASEKKSLMAIADNHTEIRRLIPGHLATLDGKRAQELCFWNPESLRQSHGRIQDKKEALEAYNYVLTASILKQVAGKKRVGIIFSGGIDSLLVAYMVQKLDIPFTCYTAGVEGAPDLEWAQKTAEQFDFLIKIKKITLKELERALPHIITTIEDHSLNQVEAAIAFYFAVQKAHQENEQIILTGQGPDEIFGGYPWYSKIVDEEGYESFEQYSWEDTLLGYKETFERENKIATAYGLEMSVPFVDPEVIEVAFRISPELKIRRGNDQIQKRIHREFGVSIGIPKHMALRKKEAAQHGANIHTALEDLAKRTGVTESMLADAGYDPDQSVTEKLGSSSRYGFRYGNQHLWKPLAQVQYYLDSYAAELNLLSQQPQMHWEQTTRRLQDNGNM
ncbi:MAG: asparagine synthetase B family protein [Thermodesulfobacteriota bacterium]